VENEHTSEKLVLFALCAKNFHNRYKFDKVLTKNNLHSFLRHGVFPVPVSYVKWRNHAREWWQFHRQKIIWSENVSKVQ